MTDTRDIDAVQPTPADAVTDPSMAPVDSDAGGPTADKDDEEPSAEEAAAQLGDFA
jgi:hypothetical protein